MEELERAWQRRMEQYRAGQEARNRLMKEVMDTRHQQIQERRKLGRGRLADRTGLRCRCVRVTCRLP